MRISLHLIEGILNTRYRILTEPVGVIDAKGYRTARILPKSAKTITGDVLFICPGESSRAGKGTHEVKTAIKGIRQEGNNDAGYNTINVASDIEFLDLYDIVISIFEEITEWYNRMSQACYMQNAIEEILGIAVEQLPQPMYVADPGYKIYALSDHPEMCEMSHGWKYAFNYGYLPLDMIISLSESQELRKNIYHNNTQITSADCFNNRFMNYVISVDNIIYGHFFVIEIFRKFLSYELELADIVGAVIANVLTKNTMFSVMTGSLYEHFIIDVISGTLTDYYLIKKQLDSLKWSDIWSFCVLRLEYQSFDGTTLRSFCGVIEKNVRFSSAVLYMDGIAILARFHSLQEFEAFRTDMLSLLRNYGLYAGVSDTFTDFTELPYRYEQASAAFAMKKKVEDKRLVRYTDVAFNHFIARSNEHMDLKRFISPQLNTLIEMDKKDGTSLYNTLRAYIENDRVVGKTAECLYLHRNTLINRLEKIKQFTGIDLDDYNEVKRLILSFAISD